MLKCKLRSCSSAQVFNWVFYQSRINLHCHIWHEAYVIWMLDAAGLIKRPLFIWFQCFVVHSVHPTPSPAPPFLLVGEGLNLQPNFQKGGAWQDLSFYRGAAGKEGVTFFRGWGLQFSKKKNKKLKSEIFNDKKV